MSGNFYDFSTVSGNTSLVNNTRDDDDEDDEDEPFPASLKIGMTAAYAAIFAVAFIGNAIGLRVVCRERLITTNLMIANMAVADLIVAIVVMPMSVSHLYIKNLWFGGVVGQITCKVAYYTHPMSVAASIFTLVMISLERFYAVCLPLRRLSCLTKPTVLTSVIWTASVVLMSPFLLLFRVESDDGVHLCEMSWPWDDSEDMSETYFVLKICFITQFVVLYAVPLILLIAINSLICRSLWLRKFPGVASEKQKAKKVREKRKIFKLLIAMVIVFAVCWFPTHLIHYAKFFKTDERIFSATAEYILFWVSHANSAVNPCLYIALNGNFRREFCKTVAALFPVHRLRYRRRTLSEQTLETKEKVLTVQGNFFNPSVVKQDEIYSCSGEPTMETKF